MNADEGGVQYKSFKWISIEGIMMDIAICIHNGLIPFPQVEAKFKSAANKCRCVDCNNGHMNSREH